MKPKPDEMPDLWVRQALSQLPDTPPPGSAFDAERVWASLRPERQAAPNRQKTSPLWWVLAACITGLALGWFWLLPPATNQTGVATNDSSRIVDTYVEKLPKSIALNELTSAKPVVSQKKQLPIERTKTRRPKRALEQKINAPPAIPLETVSQEPNLQTLIQVPLVVENASESGKTERVAARPKRRFRLVHENELRAEVAAKPKLYRTDSFVRLGTGQRDEVVQEEHRSTPVLSLTKKQNQ